MITRLTAKQKKLIPVYQKKWHDQFFSLTFDEQKARKFVKWLYKLIDKKEPTVVILDSPLAVQLAINILKFNKERIWEQLWRRLWGQLDEQLRGQLDEQLERQLWEQLNKQLREQLLGQLINQFHGKRIDKQLGRQLLGKLWRQLDKNKLKCFQFDYWGDISWFGYLAFYDYIYEELFPEIKIPIFEQYREFSKANINFLVTFENIAFISKPPVFINFDEKDRLHCKNDFAVLYADGFGTHFVNGVFFEKELFIKAFKENNMSGSEILMVKNTEQKAVLIEHYGYEKILNELKDVKVLDEVNDFSKVDNKPVKYQVLEFNLDGAILRFVRVEDHSTHKVTCLGVPRNEQTKTCKGAIKWTFGLDEKEDYAPVIET